MQQSLKTSSVNVNALDIDAHHLASTEHIMEPSFASKTARPPLFSPDEEALLATLSSCSPGFQNCTSDNPTLNAAFSNLRQDLRGDGLLALFSAFSGLFPRRILGADHAIGFKVGLFNRVISAGNANI